MNDKLLEIKGIGMITICGFIAEVGDIRRFDNPKKLQKLTGYYKNKRITNEEIIDNKEETN